MNLPKVALIDSKSRRAEKVIQAFSAKANVLLFDGDDYTFDAALVHLGDDEGRDPKIRRFLSAGTHKASIYYGGNGGEGVGGADDNRWNGRLDQREFPHCVCIWRKVDDDGSTPFSTGEVSQILDHIDDVLCDRIPANGKEGDGFKQARAIFRPPGSFPFMTALAVLCWGYIAWMQHEPHSAGFGSPLPTQPSWWLSSVGARSWEELSMEFGAEIVGCKEGAFKLTTTFLTELGSTDCVTLDRVVAVRNEIEHFIGSTWC